MPGLDPGISIRRRTDGRVKPGHDDVWELHQPRLRHGGADKGVQTIFFLLPKTKQGLVIFTNVDDGYKVYEKAVQHYLGEDGEKIISIEMNK